MNRLAALVPLKAFEGAKSRLGDRLDAAARAALAAAMATDTLTALVESDRFDAGVHVIAGAEAALEWVRALADRLATRSLSALAESVGNRGLNAALTFGRTRIVAACGADVDIMIVPADLPLLRAVDVQQFVAAAVRPGVTIVSDARADGTNAMLLSPWDAIDPAYGVGSGQRHLQAAQAVPQPTRWLTQPAFQMDVDFPADLDALVAALARDPDRGSATRACLAHHAVAARA